AVLDWIASSGEHKGNGLGCRHGSQSRSTASGRGDHVDLAAGQISRKGRQSIVLVFCKTVFDRRVAGLDISGFTQAASERGGEVGRIISAERVQEPNRRHGRLLRARRERPRRRRAAEQRYERAALHRCSHSITSSARASRLSGTVRPSAFAVLRLMTSSNLVGCWTGRLLGFSPLRMRSTYVAACLTKTCILGPYDIRPPS